LRFAGIGRPAEPSAVDITADKDAAFCKPLYENQFTGSWTLYDLRALRANFSNYGKIEPELERVIFGYDFAVLIPDPKASHPLD